MILKSFVFGILFLVQALPATIALGQSLTFSEFSDRIEEFKVNHEFDEALKFIEEHKEDFPSKDFELSKEEIFINENLRKYADNLFIFREGHKKGYFYFIDRRIPKYKPYLEFAEFNTISTDDLKLRNDAIQKSRIIYEVDLPRSFSNKRQWPLCLIFHGGGSNLEEVKKHWHSQELDSNYIKIYFQSYRHYDSNTYGWTSGDERADKELEQLFRSIINTYPIDFSKIIAAGISAGGTFAIDISVRKVIPATSFITFCPGIPRILSDENLSNKISLGLKGFIVGGEKDYYLAQQKQLTKAFRRLRNPIKHIIIRDMEHGYPPKETELIDEGVEYIFEKN